MDFIELREAISLEYDKWLESLVLGKAGAVLKQSFPDAAIDEEKLKQWFWQEQSLHSEVEYLRNDGVRQVYIDLYKSFREELDEMCIPLIIDELPHIEPIRTDGKIVGMVAGSDSYIDCVYIKPNYRRKGLARKAVLGFVNGKIDKVIRLHIINDNDVAYDFWNNLFELKEIGRNVVDTLYEIVKIKEERK